MAVLKYQIEIVYNDKIKYTLCTQINRAKGIKKSTSIHNSNSVQVNPLCEQGEPWLSCENGQWFQGWGVGVVVLHCCLS